MADDFSHDCVDIAVDFGIGGEYVTRLLDQAAQFRGYPQAIRTENGPEFTSRAFLGWGQRHGINHILIELGAPKQIGDIENFNVKFRDECLNEHWVRDAGAGPRRDPGLGAGLQRSTTTFEHGPHAAQVLRTPSSTAGC